ncbi:hypothetical protein ACFC09_32925 [Streptomyces sp. NPDC056161]|uniref:hypothetical protein n=1 Tax=Streptomyces sp. NPDC056161 TaxID=3345732 RepID=UPI0035DA72D9
MSVMVTRLGRITALAGLVLTGMGLAVGPVQAQGCVTSAVCVDDVVEGASMRVLTPEQADRIAATAVPACDSPDYNPSPAEKQFSNLSGIALCHGGDFG